MFDYSNKIAFTIDMDDWYHTPLVSGADFSRFITVDEFFASWKERFDYVTEPTLMLLNLLKKFDVKATFFIIADMVDRYPEVMKKLKETNHEIAHHSLHHTIPINTKTKEMTQSKEDWEKELIRAKNILESYFDRKIIGYRAPGAYFADWMVPILIKNGFEYDSSLVSNSIYNKSNRDLSEFPKIPFYLNEKFEVLEDKENSILEIPWVSFKMGNYYLPGGGAYFFRLFGVNYFIKMFQQHLQFGDGVFYIHSLDLSDEKFPMSNFRHRPFYWINKGKPTLNKLIKFINKYQSSFCSCGELISKRIFNN